MIGLLFSPLGSQSRSEWKGSQHLLPQLLLGLAVSGTLLNTTFFGTLPGSSSSMLDRDTWISHLSATNVLSQAGLASASCSL